MIREIVTDPFFLSQKSEPATKQDQQVIQDLLDTIHAHADHCVGMAANMIGVRKTMTGQRPVQRYPMIVVEYLDRNFKKKKQIFRDFEAQMIQHEIDHFSGILIEPTEKKLVPIFTIYFRCHVVR